MAVSAASAAGSTLFGPQGDPKTIFSIECGSVTVSSATGDPVRDCTALWPSLYHQAAPRLVAWIAASGGAVIVRPASAQPAAENIFGWRRLPVGWTQERAAVLLTHQLEDLATGLQARTCWSADSAKNLVRMALSADGLADWQLDVRAQPSEGAAAACLTIASIVQAGDRSVALVERRVRQPARGSFETAASATEMTTVALVERRVNLDISTDRSACASVSRAAALWRANTQRVGLPAERYVLIPWAHATVSGAGCAHVYVTAPGGGGPYDVYLVSYRRGVGATGPRQRPTGH
ncbi:MAG: hypothetical protein ACRDK4_01990 [Solirubrobacteraceae bacterium]